MLFIGEKKMKKLIVLVASILMVAGSSFAMDMNIGLKGLVGADNSGVSGTVIGGGVDLNIDLYKGLGLMFGSNISTAKIATTDEGLSVTNDLCINIPVMAWYNLDFSHFGLGAGAGLDCSVTSNFKMALAAALNLKWHINNQFSLVLGANGVLDCLPTLAKKQNESSSTYNFVSSDFSHNALNCTLGLEYKLGL